MPKDHGTKMLGFAEASLTRDGAEGLCLWAESPEEARNFLARGRQSNFIRGLSKIFVAKRSANSRGNNYTGGVYYRTTNDENVDVYDDVILAPGKVTELVQWCTCDIMVSKAGTWGFQCCHVSTGRCWG